jgi:hypothetical protein
MAGLRIGLTQIASFTAANTPLPTNTTGLTNLHAPLPRTLQHNRRLGVRVEQKLPGEFMLISGISYKFTPLGDDGKELT